MKSTYVGSRNAMRLALEICIAFELSEESFVLISHTSNGLCCDFDDSE